MTRKLLSVASLMIVSLAWAAPASALMAVPQDLLAGHSCGPCCGTDCGGGCDDACAERCQAICGDACNEDCAKSCSRSCAGAGRQACHSPRQASACRVACDDAPRAASCCRQ